MQKNSSGSSINRQMGSDFGAAKISKTDVLIVGGGPAGTAAAITCARNGLEVIVMEAVSFPRDHPGETVHPGIEVLWEQLGVLNSIKCAAFPRHDGHYLDCGRAITFVPYGADQRGTWLGFHAWRAELDQILMNGAKQCGVEWWQNCRAREPIIIKGHRITGAHSDRGTIHSRFLLDASGSSRWLARQIGLAISRHSEKLIVKYGYSSGTPTGSNRPIFMMRPSGWAWIAEIRPGFFAWAKLTPVVLGRDDIFFLPNQNTPLGPERGADGSWKIVCESAGPGYFVLGDSAVTLDPACSHGVLRATASGIMAAHHVVGIVRGKITEAQGAMYYREWMNQWFQRDGKLLSRQYKRYSPDLGDLVSGFINYPQM